MIPQKRMSYRDKDGVRIIIEGRVKFVNAWMRKCQHAD